MEEEKSGETTRDGWREKAREYHRLGRRAGGLRLGLGFLFLAGVLVSGLSRRLADWSRSLTDDPWSGLALFAGILFLAYELLSLPVDHYSGHRLPTRFGLSRQTPGAWLRDHLKGAGLGLLFGLLGVEFLYWLLRTQSPAVFPLWAGLGLLAFLIVTSWAAPVLLMPLFFKTKPVRNPDLERRLADLARRAGTSCRGVYVFDLGRKTRAAAAALAGVGRTRRILLSDTLLAEFTPEETAVVLAHELAHHVKRHIPVLIAAQAVLGVGALYVTTLALRGLGASLGLRHLADPAGLPLILLVLGCLGLMSAPVSRWFSRRIEAGCDGYALRMTQAPGAFVSAMHKLAALNLAEESPSPWVERLYFSHPSVSRRIAMAERFRTSAGSHA